MRNSEETSGAYGLANGALIDAAPGHAHQTAAHAPSHYHQHLTGSFGPLFRELRRVLGLTLPTAASFSGTRTDVVVALETGDLAALPPWPEIVQAVTRLTGLAQIDPQPVLALIHLELSRAHRLIAEAEEATRTARAVAGAPLPTMVTTWTSDDADVPTIVRNAGRRGRLPPPPVPVAGDNSAAGSRGAGAIARMFGGLKSLPGSGRMIALSVLLVAAGGTFAQGSAIKASLATLQTPIERLLRGAEGYLIWRSAPMKDGLRWISVQDPRTRRGDKLKVKPSV